MSAPDAAASDAIATSGVRPMECAWLRVVPSEAQQRAGVLGATFDGAVRSPFVGALYPEEFAAYDLRWPGPAVRQLGSWPLDDVAVVPRKRQTTLYLGRLEVDVRPENATSGRALLERLAEAARRSPPPPPRRFGAIWSLRSARPALGVLVGASLFVSDPSWEVAGLTVVTGLLLAITLYWEDLRVAVRRRIRRGN